MKIPWTIRPLVFALSLATMPTATNLFANADLNTLDDGTFNDSEVRLRVERLQLPVKPFYNGIVKKHIQQYVVNGYKQSEQLLGRTELYFPIFEHYLIQYNLPVELKYLPMIESGLRPNATSSAGAAGLWQFMVGTASDLGLRTSSIIDERRDPYKSTEAAVQYLAGLYDRFGNWELALSAYNCGPGNVWKAIKLGGSRDYWKIREFLPIETQNYLPRFIAASYLAQHHLSHQLQPSSPDYDLQFTRTIKVYSRLSLTKIAAATCLPEKLIYRLNPAYLKGIIPANPQGNYLVLPELSLIAFRDYLRMSGDDIQTDLLINGPLVQPAGDTELVPLPVRVKAGQSLEAIAQAYGVNVEDIIAWNGLQTPSTYYTQELLLFVRPEVAEQRNKRA